MQLQDALSQLDLGDVQKARVDQVLADAAEARTANAAQNREQMQTIMQEMRDARESGDEAAVTAAREKMTAMRTQGTAQDSDTVKKVMEILDRRQQAQLQKLIGPSARFNQTVKMVKMLKLEPEQIEKLDIIVKETEAAAKEEETDAEKTRVYREGIRKINELLTRDQRGVVSVLLSGDQVASQFRLQGERLGLDKDDQVKIGKLIAAAQKSAAGDATATEARETLQAQLTKIVEEVVPEENQQNAQRLIRVRGGRRQPGMGAQPGVGQQPRVRGARGARGQGGAPQE